jgi:hypothetical protein
MNHLVRALLAPFASFAAGALIAIFFGVFVFGVKNSELMAWIAIICGALAMIPDIVRIANPQARKRGK